MPPSAKSDLRAITAHLSPNARSDANACLAVQSHYQATAVWFEYMDTIPKLSGRLNYPAWRDQFIRVANLFGLARLFSEDADWGIHAIHAHTLLTRTLEGPVLNELYFWGYQDSTSPKTAWDMLWGMFGWTGPGEWQQMTLGLSSLNAGRFGSVRDYTNHVRFVVGPLRHRLQDVHGMPNADVICAAATVMGISRCEGVNRHWWDMIPMRVAGPQGYSFSEVLCHLEDLARAQELWYGNYNGGY